MTSAKNIIGLLIQNERSLADLYFTYSKLFKNSEFWLSLSREEEQHAQFVITLFEDPDIPEIDQKLINKKAIEDMIYSAESDIVAAKNITLDEALSRAVKYERMILEKNVFDIFASSKNPQALKLIDRLKVETTEHLDSLLAAQAQSSKE